MKRTYETPIFVAERYEFSESIANCVLKPGDPDIGALIIYENTVMCSHDNGHKASGGEIATKIASKSVTKPDGSVASFPLTIFNDGVAIWDGVKTPNNKNAKGCDYDWSGSVGGGTLFGNKITGNYGTDWFGATAENEQHRPAYDGAAFNS